MVMMLCPTRHVNCVVSTSLTDEDEDEDEDEDASLASAAAGAQPTHHS